MKNSCVVYCALALVLLFGSCGPTLYVPNTINTPMLGEKGDFRASIGGNGSLFTPGTDLQGAYAISDGIALMGNASFSGGRRNLGVNQREHFLLEGAVGAYQAFWPDKQQHKVGRAELFGGLGLGRAADNNRLGGVALFDNYQGAYRRLFVQPGWGVRTRVVDATLSARTSWVHFSNYEHRSGGELIERRRFGFATFEPVMTVALGYKYVKLYWQVGPIIPFLNAANYHSVSNDILGGHSNVGLVFSPWQEKPDVLPAIGLEPSPASEKAAEEKTDSPVTPSAESGADVGQAPKDTPLASPTLVVGVKAAMVSICIRDNGTPDGDVVSASFRGSYVLPETELDKKPYCFELQLAAGEDNVLMIHSISSGRFKPNTILLQVNSGNEEQRHILQLEEGVTEQVRIRRQE